MHATGIGVVDADAAGARGASDDHASLAVNGQPLKGCSSAHQLVVHPRHGRLLFIVVDVVATLFEGERDRCAGPIGPRHLHEGPALRDRTGLVAERHGLEVSHVDAGDSGGAVEVVEVLAAGVEH